MSANIQQLHPASAVAENGVWPMTWRAATARTLASSSAALFYPIFSVRLHNGNHLLHAMWVSVSEALTHGSVNKDLRHSTPPEIARSR